MDIIDIGTESVIDEPIMVIYWVMRWVTKINWLK
jgi:hypothetical protein